MKRTELVVFFTVMVIAIAMRLYGLSTIPPGLSPDEAMSGNSALTADRTGEYRVYYSENNGGGGLFINLQTLSVHVLGNTTYALRLVAAIAGILTVLGVYFLTRRLFDDWRIAAIASFLMAVGFWHTHFSRIGNPEILEPLFAVWGFYYLYKGIETHRLWHWALSGVLFGLGFHTTFPYRIIPLTITCTLIALWLSLHAVFSHGKYRYARHQMLGGIAMMVGVMIVVLLPMVPYLYADVSDFTYAPADKIIGNAVRTIGMFFFRGDDSWLHNIPGSPALFWPVAAFFAAGLVHSLWRFAHSWRTRGHPGVVQTLLLSWFFIGLVPAIIAGDGVPNALRTLVVSPAVYILAAVGLHWCYVAMERWYGARSVFVVTVAVLSVLAAVWVGDAHRYFVRWAHIGPAEDVFSRRYSAVAKRLMELAPDTLKFVVVSRRDASVYGTAHSLAPVMFLTDTSLPPQQEEKNIFYLTSEQYAEQQYPSGAIVIQIDP